MTINPAPESWPSAFFAWRFTLVLTLANLVSLIDRQILSLLVEPVKHDLQLSDTQIGLAQGLAFALFYAVLAVPLARVADLGNRRHLILAGLTIWSLATAASGLARTFGQLFASRVAVAVGEATLSPSAWSILADCFPPRWRATPLGVYSSGATVGMGLALIFGGIAASMAESLAPKGVAPWRLTMFIVASFSVVPMLLLWMLREPERQQIVSYESAMSSLQVLRSRVGLYAPIFLAYACVATVVYGYMAWLPTLMIRNFGMSPGEVGAALGISIAAGSAVGSIAGGMSCDWLERRMNRNVKAALLLLVTLALLVPSVLTPLGTSRGAVLAGAFVVFAVGTFPVGPIVAWIQELTPNRARARITAYYLLVVSVVGYGGGPVLIGVLTDYYFEDTSRVGWSIATMSGCGALLAVLLAWRARIVSRRECPGPAP